MDILKFSLTAAIMDFLDKLFSPPRWNSNTPDKTVVNCSFPFTGSHSLQIRNQMTKICSSAFPHVTVRFIFQSGRRLSRFFPFQDQTPKLMRLRIICKYFCQCSRALYFGQTRGIFLSQNTRGSRRWQERNLQLIPFQAFFPTHNNFFTTSVPMILPLSLLVVQTPTLSSFERAYWYQNLDPLSTTTSHPYPFLYFSLTRLFFILPFILFYFDLVGHPSWDWS